MQEIKVISAHSPVWANEARTMIDCIVKVSHLKNEVPFTASPLDPERHGRELFHRLASGEFGDIAPFVVKSGVEAASEMNSPAEGPDWANKWPELETFLQEANAESARGTIRGIGLVWGIMLDDMLVRVMKNQGASDIPSGFKDKIQIAAKEAIITPEERDALHSIRVIRDRCAHEWNMNFSNPKVEVLFPYFNSLRKTFFSDLKETRDLEMLMKMVYSSACCRLIVGFTDRL